MSDERDEQPKSVLGDLQPFEWSDEQAVSYEVALELVSQVVAECNGRISNERDKELPDTERIAAWTAQKQQFIARRRSLEVGDTAGVASLQAEATRVLRELRDVR